MTCEYKGWELCSKLQSISRKIMARLEVFLNTGLGGLLGLLGQVTLGDQMGELVLEL